MSSTYYVLLVGLVAAIAGGVLVSSSTGRHLLELSSVPTVFTLAGAAAVGGALAPGAPTGAATADAVLRAGFCLCFVLLASRSRRSAWVLAAALAVVGSYNEAWVVLALVAVGLGVGSLLADRPASGTALGALIGACTSQVLLRLSWSPVFGLSAALATLALIVVAAGGARHALRPTYRWLGRTTIGLGILIVVATVLAGVAALRARSPAEAGLAEAEAGLSAAQSTHPSSALADLRASANDLAQAHRNMTRWWTKPAGLIPVVSQNERAVTTLTLRGANVAEAAVRLVDAADASSAHDTAGTLDLTKLTALGPSVESGLVAARSAQRALTGLHSPWLLPPVSRRLSDLKAKVDLLESDESDLAQAVKVLPGLLGQSGPQRYLVMVQDPAELRGAGGLIADSAVLTADNGHLSLSDLSIVNGSYYSPPVSVDPATVQWANSEGYDLSQYPQDDSFSPDFPTDARAFEQSEAQLGGPKVNGVISVDPTVLQAILEVIGPLRVPGWPVPLSATNVLPILLHDQYVSLQGAARQSFLSAATATIFHTFTHGPLPDPITLARAFAPAVKSKHLLVYANNASVERSLQALGVDGAMPAVNGDFLEVVTQNALTDKIDWFLRRSYTYQVTYDPSDGLVNATLSITLTNEAPASGEPAYVIGGGAGSLAPAGTSEEVLTVYTPLDLAGGKASQRSLYSSVVEDGRHAYSGKVEIGPGKSARVVLHLTGTLSGGMAYHLDLGDQPVVVPDDVSISVKSTPDWKVTGTMGSKMHSGDASWSSKVTGDHQLSVQFTKD